MKKKTILTLLLSASTTFLLAQATIKPFAGAGIGMENRIGFLGIDLRGGGECIISDHVTGIAGLDLFLGNKVPKWGAAENQGAYYRQLMPSVRMQYNTGNAPGTGFLFSAGLAFRSLKTHHFESGDYHDGSFSNRTYVTESMSGKGLVLGVGYGFPLSESMTGKIEFTNQAFLMMNEQYNLTFTLSF